MIRVCVLEKAFMLFCAGDFSQDRKGEGKCEWRGGVDSSQLLVMFALFPVMRFLQRGPIAYFGMQPMTFLTLTVFISEPDL